MRLSKYFRLKPIVRWFLKVQKLQKPQIFMAIPIKTIYRAEAIGLNILSEHIDLDYLCTRVEHADSEFTIQIS